MSRLWVLLRSYLGARRRFQSLRGVALEAYQDERARAIVAFAVRHSSFYRTLYAGHDLAAWQSLPTIDKAAMMAGFDTFNTTGVRLDDAMAVALRAERERNFSPTVNGVTVGLSSGTSGHRGLFLVSSAEQLVWAGVVLARGLPRLRWRGYRLAFFLRSNSNLYESLGRWIDFRYFDLMTPIAEAVVALNGYRPDLVVGPPSLLSMLAGARTRGELRIQPERLVSVAEVLEPQDEARIREAFGVPVRQVYQCTEGLLAISCSRGSLHVQEDFVALQLEPVVGQEGMEASGESEQRVTPIVTDLWRRTQPIIRYRLNDVLTMATEPCSCGSAFRVISRIEGRCDDICYFPQSDGTLRPFFPDTLRRMVLLSHPDIEDYQVFQEGPGRLRVHLQVRAGDDFSEIAASLRATVEESISRYDCQLSELQIERGLEAVRPNEKRRRVVRH